jgi:hypothetical protein
LRRSQSRIPLAVRDIDRFIDDNAAALGSTPTSQAQAQLNAARPSLDDHSKEQATRELAVTGWTVIHERDLSIMRAQLWPN